MEFPALRLQQHLGEAGGSGGITIDCKDVAFSSCHSASGVGQQRIVRGISDEAAQMKKRRVSIAKTRVVVHEVGAAPLGVLPVGLMNSPVESDARGGCQSRSFVE